MIIIGKLRTVHKVMKKFPAAMSDGNFFPLSGMGEEVKASHGIHMFCTRPDDGRPV